MSGRVTEHNSEMFEVLVEAINPSLAAARPEREHAHVVRLNVTLDDLGFIGVGEKDAVRLEDREGTG